MRENSTRKKFGDAHERYAKLLDLSYNSDVLFRIDCIAQTSMNTFRIHSTYETSWISLVFFIRTYDECCDVRALYASPILNSQGIPHRYAANYTIYEFMINAVARWAGWTENTNYERTVREIIHTRWLRIRVYVWCGGFCAGKYTQLLRNVRWTQGKINKQSNSLDFYFLVCHFCLHFFFFYQCVRITFAHTLISGDFNLI